jgi:ADP-heptose:LPS heptosyltransferase
MERNWPFVLMGSKDVSHLVPSLRSLNPAGSVVSLAGQTSLAEFAAIISRARLVIASHPAPVRMAEAFNRPRMALYPEQNQPQPVLAPVAPQPAA